MALRYYQQALALDRDLHDRSTEATALNNVGTAYLKLERYEEARRYFDQALSLSRETKDLEVQTATLNNQAMLAGAIFGYRGLVREILQRITAEQKWEGRVRVVATGGYAKLIARELPEVDIVHQNLTLEGLRLVGCMNSDF